jgi:hypothetical protein
MGGVVQFHVCRRWDNDSDCVPNRIGCLRHRRQPPADALLILKRRVVPAGLAFRFVQTTQRLDVEVGIAGIFSGLDRGAGILQRFAVIGRTALVSFAVVAV